MTWDAVFLDRDGTLNVAAPPGAYVLRPHDLVLLPGAAGAVARLNAAGVPVFVVTNQRCVALGLASLAEVDAVNTRLADLLAAQGAMLDGVLVCPHEEGACDCRKPRDGLIRRVLADRPRLRPGRCALVGDSPSDVQAGEPLGLFRVLLSATAGAGAAEDPGGPVADLVAPDLAAAVDLLMTRGTSPRE